MPGILSDPYGLDQQDPQSVAFGDPEAHDVGYQVPTAPHIPGGMGVRSPNGMPGLYQNAGAVEPQQPQQEDTGLLGKQPSQAAMLGLLSAGLGILANNTGHYGQAGPAIGRGGLIGVQTYLGAKQQEDVHNAMQQRVAQQQQAGQYQQALKQAYVVKPDTGEVDVAATRKNLAALDPRLAMKFDQEQTNQQATMTNLSRKNEVAQSLIAERRSRILGAAKQNALEHYFGILQKTQDPVKAQKASADYYMAQVGDAQKNNLLPTDYKPAPFNVEAGLRSLSEDGAPALMNDEGQPAEGTPIQAQGTPQEGGMMNVAQSTAAPAAPTAPTTGNGGVDWAEAYQFAWLHKHNPNTALNIINPRTGKLIPNEPLLKQKMQLKADMNINAAGGDINLMPGKKAEEKIEGGLMDVTNGLARLGEMKQSFKPEYQQWATQAGMSISKLADKAGLLPESAKKSLAEYSDYMQSSADNMNRYIKEITGAQMGEAEAVRLRKAVPDPENDSPVQFQAKMDRSIKTLEAAGKRYLDMSNKGFSEAQIKKMVSSGMAPSLDKYMEEPHQAPKAPPKPVPSAVNPRAAVPTAPGTPKATKRYNPVNGKFEVIQ